MENTSPQQPAAATPSTSASVSMTNEATTPPAPAPAPASKPYKLHRRFDRTGRLIGDTGMQRLQNAHVVVFGLGGVGSYTVEGLVRSGVGRLTLVDHDDVCVTNSNRQLHATVSTVGKSKAELMAQRCKQINPDVDVQWKKEFYRADNAEELLPAGQRVDYVVDAIDNVKAKLHLLNRCVTLGLPVVSSMGAAGRLDPTRIRVEDLCETHMCQFAKDIRKLLKRKYNIDTNRPTGITAVYSIEPDRDPVPLNYDAAHEGFLCVCPQDNDFHTCDHRTQINGSVAFVTSVFGMCAAGVVVRRIAGAR